MWTLLVRIHEKYESMTEKENIMVRVQKYHGKLNIILEQHEEDNAIY